MEVECGSVSPPLLLDELTYETEFIDVKNIKVEMDSLNPTFQENGDFVDVKTEQYEEYGLDCAETPGDDSLSVHKLESDVSENNDPNMKIDPCEIEKTEKSSKKTVPVWIVLRIMLFCLSFAYSLEMSYEK